MKRLGRLYASIKRHPGEAKIVRLTQLSESIANARGEVYWNYWIDGLI